ncbi:MAG: threonine/serine dehydratase [Gammaproteobacteria bacterium]|nr:threonine/serine dehydratase [Gammaproteobacteria bacterium]
MLNLESVEQATQLLKGKVHRTPILQSSTLNEIAGCDLYFKCENLQKTGAFKARGALNSVLNLPEECHAVITHSSGNHGAALAWAARQQNLTCYVVCPETASATKKANIRRYGGIIIPCGPELASREEVMREFLDSHESHVVPPYDDDLIIAGQGTMALELLDQVKDLEEIWVPVGGGGLISGCIVGAGNRARVVGAEPELAGETYESLQRKERLPPYPPKSIADGLLAGVGVRNFEILSRHQTSVFLVTEAEIVEAMRLIWSTLKIVIEPSSAVPMAALLKNKEKVRGKHVGVVLTGGNVQVDLAK